ncbi:unnamed protein product [Orchesella dallaii]|uniref:Uncharacterized protein n=1 Tax=Orchesella dallaii TaxID=48710 RepID=A0ABP1QRT8_9HEXA
MGSKFTGFVVLLVGVWVAIVLAAPEGKKEEKEESSIPSDPKKTDENSHCPDATCTPAPKEHKCEAKYERDDKCCPVWHCDNGETVYGIQRSFSSGPGKSDSSSSSWSFNTSDENEGGSKDPSSSWIGFGPLSRRFFNHSSFFDDF